MKKLLLLFLIPFLMGAAPVRQVDYQKGEVITDTDVESNENAVFNYLQAGVDTYATDSIKDTHIDWGTGGSQVSQDDVVDGSTYKQYNPASVTITGGTITGITDLTVSDGGTGVSTLSDGFILLGNGTSAIQTLDVTGNGSIIIGDGATAPTTLSAFTSSTGTLKHEYGGLEADVSAYSGLLKISGGATSQAVPNTDYLAVGGEQDTLDTVCDRSPVTDQTLSVGNLFADTQVSGVIVRATDTVTGVVVDTQYLEYSTSGALTLRDNLALNNNYLSGDGDNEGLYINSSGNVGIGTTGPTLKLDMAASSAIGFAGTAILSDSAGTMTLSDVDGIDATTETTLEGAIDIAGEVTGTGLGSVVIADSLAVTSWNLTTPTITTSLTTSTPTTLSAAELDRLDGLTSAIIDDDKINTYSELNTIVADVTLTHNGLIDTSAELYGILGDETGSASGSPLAVFNQNPSIAGATLTGNIDVSGGDLELPQASPAAPDADGEVEIDLTDNTLVVQSTTDNVWGKKVHSWTCVLAFPDLLQAEIDNWIFKSIDASEFPHGVVITEINLKTSASSTYAVNVENWDDPTTINATNPTIDAITTSASTEVSETTITYSTIAAGQIIMLDLDTDDIGWIQIEIQYIEPIS